MIKNNGHLLLVGKNCLLSVDSIFFSFLIASDNKNYMIEDTENFINMSDVKSNFTSFFFYGLFRQIHRFRDFELF